MGEQVVARLNGGVAQLGEHLPCKQGVKSSNLSVSTQAYYTRALEIKQSAKKHKPYLENRIMKLILKVSKR